MSYKAKDAAERFWTKVDKNGPNGCWLWTAALNRDGYGQFYSGRIDGRDRNVGAHRFAYALLVGPIPNGLELDHVRERGCRYRHCVNPAHLEPVKGQINKLRGDTLNAANAAKTGCPRGHPYDEANTYITPDGRRDCRTCRSQRSRKVA